MVKIVIEVDTGEYKEYPHKVSVLENDNVVFEDDFYGEADIDSIIAEYKNYLMEKGE